VENERLEEDEAWTIQAICITTVKTRDLSDLIFFGSIS
jgi:hypothetical protein